jgi:hypothetical protein
LEQARLAGVVPSKLDGIRFGRDVGVADGGSGRLVEATNGSCAGKSSWFSQQVPVVTAHHRPKEMVRLDTAKSFLVQFRDARTLQSFSTVQVLGDLLRLRGAPNQLA